jgi:mono/diheme cytochrome c family protein
MPKWGPIITNAELDDLAAYLLSLKPKEENPGF